MVQNKSGAVQFSSPPLERPDPLTGSVRRSSPPLPRPKNLNEQTKDFLAPKQEPKPDTSLGDTEFDMEILPEFINPIGRLGHNVKNYNILFSDTISDQPIIDTFSGRTREYAGIYDRDTNKMTISDVRRGTLADYGLEASAVAKNPTFEHEAIHRGLNILREYYRNPKTKDSRTPYFNKDAFIKRGMEEFNFSKEEMQEAAQFLFINDLYSELDVELLTELNDSKRLGLPEAQTYYERFEGREYKDSDKKVTKKDLKKYVDRAEKIGPVLKMMALDRLQDENPEGGITDDAQNVPVKKYTPVKKKNFILKNIDKIKKMYKQRGLNKKYKEASKNMPSEFSGGGGIFKLGYTDKPEVLAFYNAAKDELIYLDGRIEKNPNERLLNLGLSLGSFKVIGTGHSKGGDAKMKEQMEMLLIGGSNERDPISGNEVPIGSLPEEVRDDVPALLSEGEYVIPADVVRFFGVKFFEDLRIKAKMGLSRMAATGRIGGEPIESQEEPIEAAGGALVRGDSTIYIDDPINMLIEAIMKTHPSFSFEEADAFARDAYNTAIAKIPYATRMKLGGIIKANTGVSVDDDASAAAQAEKEAAEAQQSITSMQGPSQASIQQFAQAASPSMSSTSKTKLFINDAGGTLQILVDTNGVPLYGGAPKGYHSIDSAKGKELAAKYGFSGEAAATADVVGEETIKQTTTPQKTKKDRSLKDLLEEQDKREAAVKKAMKTSATRLNLTTPEQLKKYENLSFTQRLKLADLEIKGKDKFTDADITRIQSELDNPESSELGGFAGEVVSNILGAFGIGKDKTDTDTEDFIKSSFDKDATASANIIEARNKADKALTGTSTVTSTGEGKDRIYTSPVVRDDKGKVISGAERVDTGEATADEIKALKDSGVYNIGGRNTGGFVTKPKRKPRAKRKSLGQKIK